MLLPDYNLATIMITFPRVTLTERDRMPYFHLSMYVFKKKKKTQVPTYLSLPLHFRRRRTSSPSAPYKLFEFLPPSTYY